MSLADEIKLAHDQETAEEKKIEAVLDAVLAKNTNLSKQLADAIAQLPAGTDTTTLRGLLDDINADNADMQAKIDASNGSGGPAAGTVSNAGTVAP